MFSYAEIKVLQMYIYSNVCTLSVSSSLHKVIKNELTACTDVSVNEVQIPSRIRTFC